MQDSGSTQPNAPSPEEQVLLPQAVSATPRPTAGPWSRFWARAIDTSLLCWIIAEVLLRIAPEIASGIIVNGTLIAGTVLLPAAIVLETICLAVFGNSPGKALIGIKVLTSSGQKLSFAGLTQRQFGVYWRGLGLGVPIVSLFTLAAAHKRVSRGGSVAWDESTHSRCVSTGSSTVRTAVVALAFCAALAGLRMQDRRRPEIDDRIEATASQLAKSLPVRVDSITVLQKIVAAPGRTLRYEYTVTSSDPQTRASLVGGLRGSLGQRLVHELCTNASMKALRDGGATFVYSYATNDGARLGEIVIPSDECTHPTRSLLAERKAAAERGDVVAQFDVAKSFDEGADDPDGSKAFDWYVKSANGGHVPAMAEVARRYANGAGVQQSSENARTWWLRAALGGSAEAQYEHAQRFGVVMQSTIYVWPFESLTSEQSAREFISWLRRSADQNFVKAKYDLGMTYLLGVSDAKSRPPRVLIERQPGIALPLLQTAAATRYWRAQWALAVLYQAGFGSIRPDRALSDRYWAELDQQTAAEVQQEIGVHYSEFDRAKYRGNNKYRGRALTFDETNTVAFEWMSKAATQGFPAARYLLGTMYHEGRGVWRNDARAVELWTSGAEQGHYESQQALAFAYLNGTGVIRDYSQAHKWLLKASAENTANSWSDVHKVRNALGVLYEYGSGVPRDGVLAYAWYNIAAAGGYAKARDNRTRVERQLTAEEVQEAQALSRSWSPGFALVRGRAQTAARVAQNGSVDRGGALHAYASGSGFYVAPDGMALTNNHVVDGCTELRVPAESAVAKVVVADQTNDLALIKVDGKHGSAAEFPDSDELRQGENVFVFGFPLDGYLPASGNITPGLVAALAGPGNNSSFVQITAPVQPGNSGGPLLDNRGRVVGVIVGKADALKIASVTGDIPQNINFAIGPRTVRAFLDANRVGYRRKDRSFLSRDKDSITIAEEARAVSIKIECWRPQ